MKVSKYVVVVCVGWSKEMVSDKSFVIFSQFVLSEIFGY